jgi:UDP-N-acetylmuramate: L-alanyl-gamma-D-glutamyl-meso-diaminopimelate ligase
LFEPRSNSSRRRIFQHAYSEAFDRADVIAIKEPPDPAKVTADERLDIKRLVADIHGRGGDAHSFTAADALLEFVLARWLPGDVVLSMSNGDFDGLPPRLWTALKTMGETGLANPISPRD